MKAELTSKWFDSMGSKWGRISRALFEQGNLDPLCAWGYAYQYQNFMPEYKIELITPTAKYTIKSKSIPHLRDAFRVYRNPYLKVKLT